MSEKFWSLHGQYLRSKSWGLMLRYFNESIGDKKLTEISVGDLQKFYNDTVQRTSAPTANRYLTLLKCIFNKAKAWGDFHGDNPCNRVSNLKEPPHRLRFLSKHEIKTLLEKTDPRLYPILVCAIMTGMRRGEILGLRWENVSLEHNTIYILQSKSGKPREIPLAPKLRDVLLSLEPISQGPVFEIPIITLRRLFDKATRDAGLLGFRFHDLRHTFASHYIMRTSDLPALQRILGHSSPMMTQRYAHLAQSHLASEMQIFDSSMPIQRPDFLADGHLYGHQTQTDFPTSPEKCLISKQLPA